MIFFTSLLALIEDYYCVKNIMQIRAIVFKQSPNLHGNSVSRRTCVVAFSVHIKATMHYKSQKQVPPWYVRTYKPDEVMTSWRIFFILSVHSRLVDSPIIRIIIYEVKVSFINFPEVGGLPAAVKLFGHRFIHRRKKMMTVCSGRNYHLQRRHTASIMPFLWWEITPINYTYYIVHRYIEKNPRA